MTVQRHGSPCLNACGNYNVHTYLKALCRVPYESLIILFIKLFRRKILLWKKKTRHRVPKGVIIPQKCDLVSVVTKSCATSREEILAKKKLGSRRSKKSFLTRLFISTTSITFFHNFWATMFSFRHVTTKIKSDHIFALFFIFHFEITGNEQSHSLFPIISKWNIQKSEKKYGPI